MHGRVQYSCTHTPSDKQWCIVDSQQNLFTVSPKAHSKLGHYEYKGTLHYLLMTSSAGTSASSSGSTMDGSPAPT